MGGTILLAGANMGYLRQMDQYEAEEAKWGKGKDKWGRQVPRELRGVPHDWSPQKVAVRALGIGTLVAVGTFAVGTAATFWYFDVDSAQGFSDRMREVIPPKFEAMQAAVRPPLDALKRGLGGLLGGGASRATDE